MTTQNQESPEPSESESSKNSGKIQYTTAKETIQAGIKRTNNVWKFIIAIIIAALGTLLGAVLINWIQ